MSLGYSYIDWVYPTSIPPPKVNGGLYTGEPATGPWGNYPVIPEPHELSKNLLSADPPPNAEKILVSYNREGNNNVKYDDYEPYDKAHPYMLCRK